MAIARKPKPHNTLPGDIDVDALIAKGGTVAPPTGQVNAHGSTQVAEEGKETAAFTLRIPATLLTTLDDHLKRQPYKTPRQFWILEAIVEKLEREMLKPYQGKEDSTA